MRPDHTDGKLLHELHGLQALTHDAAASPMAAYQVLGHNQYGDLPAHAINSNDPQLLQLSDDMLDGMIESVAGEGTHTWLVRLIWPMMRDGLVTNGTDSNELLTETCRMAAHTLLKCGQAGVFTNRVAYLFLTGGYGEALDLLLPYTSITFRLEKIKEPDASADDEFADSYPSNIPPPPQGKTEPDAESHDEPGERATADPGDAASTPMADARMGEGDGSKTQGSSPQANVASPLARANRQYLFDVERCERECRRIMGTAQVAQDSPSNEYGNHIDATVALFHSLAGAAVFAQPLLKGLSDRDEAQVEGALRMLDTYADIVREDGVTSLPLMATETAWTMVSRQKTSQQISEGMDLMRATTADMAAVVLTRVPGINQAGQAACRLLEMDMDGYEQSLGL